MAKLTEKSKRKIVQEALGDFPLRIVFSLSRDLDTKEYSINFSKTKNTKIKIDNFKFSKLKKYSFGNTIYTPLSIHDVKNFEELEKILDDLSEIWTDGKDVK